MKPQFVISCPIDTYSGYGARSRDVVKAIIELDKYNVRIMSQRWGQTPWGFIRDNPEWDFLQKHIIPGGQLQRQPEIWMQITVPNEFQPVGKYNIGCTAGIETTACHHSWVEGCNRMDLIFASSNHSKKVFMDSRYVHNNEKGEKIGELKLEKPVEVLFEGANLDVYRPITVKKDSSIKLNKIKEDFCYLFVGHWIKGEFGEDRKNVPLLIKAFYETFKNKSKKPALILKTSHAASSYMDRREIMKQINDLKNSVKGDRLPNVYLLHGDLSDDEMNELYNHPKVKAMVCLTKGEGFGRPLLEFSLSNKPIVTTNYSGHLDFLKPEFTNLVGGQIKQIHESALVENILIKESGWFEPRHDEIDFYLRDVFSNYKKYVNLAKRQGYYSRSNFSFDKMREKIDTLLSSYAPEFPKQVKLKLPGLKKIELPKKKKIKKLVENG